MLKRSGNGCLSSLKTSLLHSFSLTLPSTHLFHPFQILSQNPLPLLHKHQLVPVPLPRPLSWAARPLYPNYPCRPSQRRGVCDTHIWNATFPPWPPRPCSRRGKAQTVYLQISGGVARSALRDSLVYRRRSRCKFRQSWAPFIFLLSSWQHLDRHYRHRATRQ